MGPWLSDTGSVSPAVEAASGPGVTWCVFGTLATGIPGDEALHQGIVFPARCPATTYAITDMSMRDQESTSRQQHASEATLAHWVWLGAIALVALPVTGVLAAVLTLDLTRSFDAHVAAAAILPAALATLVARRFGAPSGLVLRLALMAALGALVLLDLAWSGVTG
jgi:hypothetical protein